MNLLTVSGLYRRLFNRLLISPTTVGYEQNHILFCRTLHHSAATERPVNLFTAHCQRDAGTAKVCVIGYPVRLPFCASPFNGACPPLNPAHNRA